MKSPIVFLSMLISFNCFSQVLVKQVGIWQSVFEGSELFAQLDSFTYFIGTDSAHGAELWRTDGTEAGTSLVVDINPGSSDGLVYCPLCPGNGCCTGSQIKMMKGSLYFWANDGIHGFELFKSDGTAAGTSLVKDINVGAQGASTTLTITVLGTRLIFETAIADNQTWVSDGTPAGTLPLLSNHGDSIGWAEYGFFIYGTKAYFITMVNDIENSSGLWISDGTSTGTTFHTFPGAPYASVPTLGWNGSVLLGTSDTNNYSYLWSIDTLTSLNTMLLKSQHYVSAFVGLDSISIIAEADTGYYSNYYSSNGTFTGTHFFTRISQGGVTGGAIARNNLAYIKTPNVWYRTDGTANGTAACFPAINVTSSVPEWLFFNDEFLYLSSSPDEGVELYKCDADNCRSAPLNPICSGTCSSYPEGFFNTGRMVLFAATNAQGSSLWRIDPTMLSITPTEEFKRIDLYPDPTSSLLKLKSNEPSDNQQYEILNITGTTLVTGNLHDEAEINVAAFAPGIYFVTFHDRTGKQTGVSKFIKD